jgi:hypothetical protein
MTDGRLQVLTVMLMLIIVVFLIRTAYLLNHAAATAERSKEDYMHLLRRLEKTITRMENATGVVAHDLAESVARADATDGPDGAAADAALRTGDSAAAIHKRQDER